MNETKFQEEFKKIKLQFLYMVESSGRYTFSSENLELLCRGWYAKGAGDQLKEDIEILNTKKPL